MRAKTAAEEFETVVLSVTDLWIGQCEEWVYTLTRLDGFLSVTDLPIGQCEPM